MKTLCFLLLPILLTAQIPASNGQAGNAGGGGGGGVPSGAAGGSLGGSYPNPDVLLLNPTNSSLTVPLIFGSITSADLLNNKFLFSQCGAANGSGSRTDQSFSWGYNLTPCGRQNTSDLANGWVVESYYNPTGTPQSELYTQYYGTDGTSRRPIFITTPLGTNAPAIALQGSVNFNSADANTVYGIFNSSGLIMSNSAGLYADNDIRGNSHIGVGNGISNGTSLSAVIYAKSSLASVSMRLENTSGSGRKWEWNSYTDGKFYLTDSTGGADRLTIDSTGLVSVGGPALQIVGGTQPTCNAAARGEINVVGATHTAGVKDSVVVCAADAADTYAWRVIY